MALFESLPDQVTIYEVAPRDGLQNERTILATEDKARLIEALLTAGLRRIEVTSFVSPKWVPQLADAEQLLGRLSARAGELSAAPPRVASPAESGARDASSGAHGADRFEPARRAAAGDAPRFIALCPNLRGLARARAAGIAELAVFVSASEEHNRDNLNDSIENTLARLKEVVAEARAQGLYVRGCVSTLFGFRSEHDVELERGLQIGRALMDMGCSELSLSDTMGIATPKHTRDVLRRFLAEYPPSRLSLHMHDTRGTALANVLVGLELGLRDFDSALAGLGGCPFAKGAAGNLATEDLVYMLHGMGVETGIALDKLIEAGKSAAAAIGRELPGKVHRAGLPPAR